MTRTTDVVVVGGGLTGLVAATTAARAGGRVALLEARTRLGGRARTTDRQGFLHNEGAHALYLGGEARSILAGLGIDPPGRPPELHGALGLRRGRLGLLPSGPATLVRSPLVGVRGKVRLGRLLSTIARIDPTPLAQTSLTAWLDDACPEPDARAVLMALVRTSTYCDDPDHVSAGAVVLQIQRALDPGVRYLDGGWQTLVDGVRSAAVAAGVELRTGSKVARVEPGPTVVLASGDTVDATAVVIAGLAPTAVADLLGDASPSARRWALDARPSRVAALDVALPGPWTGAASVVLGVDETVYLSVHSVARVAPDGATLVSLLKYLRPDVSTDAADDRRQLERLLELTRPGWRDVAVDVRFQHRLVAATDVPRAAAGGLAGRPGPIVAELPGVLVAGDWVGPTGLLADAGLSSAVVAANRAVAVPAAR